MSSIDFLWHDFHKLFLKGGGMGADGTGGRRKKGERSGTEVFLLDAIWESSNKWKAVAFP
jgi:hypothetical protein